MNNLDAQHLWLFLSIQSMVVGVISFFLFYFIRRWINGTAQDVKDLKSDKVGIGACKISHEALEKCLEDVIGSLKDLRKEINDSRFESAQNIRDLRNEVLTLIGIRE